MVHTYIYFISKKSKLEGHGAGLVVIVHANFSDGPSLNPAEACSFFLLICCMKISKIRVQGWPNFKKS